MSNDVATRPENPVANFSNFMDGFKKQIALALPKHLNADRMARLAVTQFSSTPALQACEPRSILGSIMTAATLGLEPGVNGQGFLVPYFDNRKQVSICTFIPGWKGLVDIVNRSGRANVWTGAVHNGDFFEYELGDRPFVKHKPGDESEEDQLTHVYAIGRVTGSEWPVIEVWTMAKVRRHRDQFNKVGNKHYSLKPGNWEAYARKVPLLQVIKYMPSSVELSNALAADAHAERGQNATIDGQFKIIPEPPFEDDDQSRQDEKRTELPACTPESFDKKKAGWKATVEKGIKSVNDLIATIQTKELLTDDQKVEIASWAVKQAATEGASQ